MKPKVIRPIDARNAVEGIARVFLRIMQKYYPGSLFKAIGTPKNLTMRQIKDAIMYKILAQLKCLGYTMAILGA